MNVRVYVYVCIGFFAFISYGSVCRPERTLLFRICASLSFKSRSTDSPSFLTDGTSWMSDLALGLHVSGKALISPPLVASLHSALVCQPTYSMWTTSSKQHQQRCSCTRHYTTTTIPSRIPHKILYKLQSYTLFNPHQLKT